MKILEAIARDRLEICKSRSDLKHFAGSHSREVLDFC
jgi:hypothetical protein